MCADRKYWRAEWEKGPVGLRLLRKKPFEPFRGFSKGICTDNRFYRFCCGGVLAWIMRERYEDPDLTGTVAEKPHMTRSFSSVARGHLQALAPVLDTLSFLKRAGNQSYLLKGESVRSFSGESS